MVVTDRPPPAEPLKGSRGRPSLVVSRRRSATAKEIAGDKSVTIASVDIIQQALKLGLVDEICISQVPVLFGTSTRFFGELVGGHVLLEDPIVVPGTRALHLRLPDAPLIGARDLRRS
jgi:dihydrofolate reductase